MSELAPRREAGSRGRMPGWMGVNPQGTVMALAHRNALKFPWRFIMSELAPCREAGSRGRMPVWMGVNPQGTVMALAHRNALTFLGDLS